MIDVKSKQKVNTDKLTQLKSKLKSETIFKTFSF